LKILLIHNSYGKYSGEEAVVDAQMALLKEHGHEVNLYSRSSAELDKGKWKKIIAFFTGLYNPVSVRQIKHILKSFLPDVVHIHNLYPLVSPSVLPVIRKKGVPVVMTAHNYRLVCPNGLFYSKGEICEKCTGSYRE